VSLEFAGRFDVPDEKWFNFVDFLEEQRTEGHVNGYDDFAGSSDWKGHTILDLARKRSPDALQVSQAEYVAFRVGIRRRTNRPVKERMENPFQGHDLVLLAARQEKPLPPVPAPAPETAPDLDPNQALMQAAGASARRRRLRRRG
jgi:hypothetical protein